MTPCTPYLQKEPLSWLFIFLPQYGPPWQSCLFGHLRIETSNENISQFSISILSSLSSPRGLLSVAVHQCAGGQAGRQAALLHHDS